MWTCNKLTYQIFVVEQLLSTQIGPWLWRSWQSGRFPYQRSVVRIPTSTKIISNISVNCYPEKTKIKKKRPGMAHLKKVHTLALTGNFRQLKRQFADETSIPNLKSTFVTFLRFRWTFDSGASKLEKMISVDFAIQAFFIDGNFTLMILNKDL